jgi:hypothetical protein
MKRRTAVHGLFILAVYLIVACNGNTTSANDDIAITDTGSDGMNDDVGLPDITVDGDESVDEPLTDTADVSPDEDTI